MGRWKAGAGGAAVYDPNDTGPNQVAPPAGALDLAAQQQAASTPQTGNTGLVAPGSTAVDSTQSQTPAPATSPLPYDRTKFRDEWQGGGGQTVQDLQNYLTRYGLQNQMAANGVVTLPGGERVDMLKGAKVGGQGAQWMNPDAPSGALPGNNIPTLPAPMSLPGGGGTSSMMPPQIGGPGGGADVGGSVRDSILQLLKSQQQPINTDELNASPEATAYRRVQERELLRNRAQMAESAAARGVGVNQAGEQSGALQSGIGQGQEALAERMQGFSSQLVGREMQNRRDQLMQALQLGAGVMGKDQEAQLRRELSNLDAQLRREGMRSQESMQGRDIGSRENMFGQQQNFNYDQLQAEQDYRQAQMRALQAQYAAGGGA